MSHGEKTLMDFQAVTQGVERLLKELSPEQLEWTTPCTDWNVGQLVNHMIGGLQRAAATIDGKPLPELDDDHLAIGAMKAYSAAAGSVSSAAEHAPGFDALVESFMGPQPVESVLRMYIDENIAHGWDLATALETELDVSDDLAADALQSWKQNLTMIPQEEGGMIGPSIPAPEGASTLDQLAALIGRRV